jgi:hypothetical protein
MKKMITVIWIAFLVYNNCNSQTVDFAVSTLMQLNIEKQGFSMCSFFHNIQNFKLLYQNEETCYYKCNFGKSNADSVLIYSEEYPDYSNNSEVTMYEVRIYQYYSQLSIANNDYNQLLSDLRLELLSKPELYNSCIPGTYLYVHLNDTAHIIKRDCNDNVFQSFNIQSPFIFGRISTDLECRKQVYRITIAIRGSLLTSRREL